MSESDDFHENMVVAWFEIDLGIHGAAHEVAAVAANRVIFFSLFLETELENKVVLATKTLEVAGIKLRKNNDNGSALGHVQDEFGAMIIGGPGNIQCCPLLSDGPFGPKETGSVEVLVLLQQVSVRDPKELYPG